MKTQTRAYVRMTLNAYATPDTSGTPVGTVAAGLYAVVGTKTDPDGTEYMQLSGRGVPGGTAWICSVWSDSQYAVAEPVTGMPEATLIRLLPAFVGWSYGGQSYPWPLYDLGLQLPPPDSNVCDTFVEALVIKAWGETYPDFTWSMEQHEQFMLETGGDFADVHSLIDAGIATSLYVDVELPPVPWTMMQLWFPENGGSGGHTLIVLDVDWSTNRILTLESNDDYGLFGPGYRGIGPLDSVGPDLNPGPSWATLSVWSWADFVGHYSLGMQAAQLKVTDVQWIATNVPDLG